MSGDYEMLCTYMERYVQWPAWYKIKICWYWVRNIHMACFCLLVIKRTGPNSWQLQYSIQYYAIAVHGGVGEYLLGKV